MKRHNFSERNFYQCWPLKGTTLVKTQGYANNPESESESCSVMSDSLPPHGLYSPWNSPGQNTEVNTFPSPGDLPNPGIKPRSPALQVDSLPADPQGKPKNTGVTSLSLLQWIFLTQESDQSFLHCRQLLYQLSYQGSLFVNNKWLVNKSFEPEMKVKFQQNKWYK